jgi:rSAM/selenodomain-associated transferase 2
MKKKPLKAAYLRCSLYGTHVKLLLLMATAPITRRFLPHRLADKVITSAKGRAKQMNNGAGQVTGDILIYLHTDTCLPKNALPLIQQEISSARLWGHFDIQLSGEHFMLKVIALMMNWRSKLTGIATGDQVIFVTRPAFEAVGQYPEINLMKDIALCKALKKISPPINLKAKVISSGRRWEHSGIYKTILLMWSLRLRYFFGADPQTLAFLYTHGAFTHSKFSGLWRRIKSPDDLS